jgi:SAM-dependent methyltransferase
MSNSDAEKRLRDGPRLDPAGADFWEARYREAVTPWDAGSVPAALAGWIPTLPAERRVLIPGCGTGYEVAAFARAGHDVLAMDFSPAAVARACAALGPLADRVREGDFFSFDAGSGFHLVYERAFLCALPRRMWPAYAPRMAAVLRPGGLLAGFFLSGEGERGPPFPLHPGELETLLGGVFERIDDQPVADSIPAFAGRERWQVWRRR